MSNNLLEILGYCDENTKYYYKYDVNNFDSESINQFSGNQVFEYLNNNNLVTLYTRYYEKIINEGINSQLNVHGPRHIKDVLFFALLIGNECLDKNDLELLLNAAIYHDVSRKTENYEHHSKRSAQIASERLNGKYSSEQLGIILTAIEFHEVPRNDIFVDKIFEKIAEKYGVSQELMKKTRIISEILKDADALDRCRFVNNSRLNPKFLKYDFSKKLIKLSASINETYACIDLENYDDKDLIEKALTSYSPQEVIRIIRKNNLFDPRYILECIVKGINISKR